MKVKVMATYRTPTKAKPTRTKTNQHNNVADRRTMQNKILYYMDIIRVNWRGKIRFWTRIKARNHKILWSSEQLNSKRSAFKPVIDIARVIGFEKCRVVYYDRINQTKEVM